MELDVRRGQPFAGADEAARLRDVRGQRAAPVALEQGEIRLDKIEVLVLDEVDRMLDMGFLPDVKRIVAKVPKNRQTLFFTATLPPEIEQLAAWALRDPFKISVARERSTAETITHAFYPVVQSQKFDLLVHLLEQTEYKSVIIFSRTKSGADYVASRLKAGTVWINTYNLYDAAMPFGGYKQSGYGRDLGKHALDNYTETKAVWVDLRR